MCNDAHICKLYLFNEPETYCRHAVSHAHIPCFIEFNLIFFYCVSVCHKTAMNSMEKRRSMHGDLQLADMRCWAMHTDKVGALPKMLCCT